MMYGPDFVSKSCILLCSWGMIGVTYAVLRVFMRLDRTGKTVIWSRELCVWLLCLVSGECVYCIVRKVLCQEIVTGSGATGRNVMGATLLWSVVAGCLVAACIMDLESREVYDYVWWVCAGACTGLLVLCGVQQENAMEILLFFLLQEIFFSKMYGRADCHAFSVCAFAQGILGKGMREFLIHMLTAFSILAVIQLMKGNIGSDGNLKRAVPFLPYIAAAFWINSGALFLR